MARRGEGGRGPARRSGQASTRRGATRSGRGPAPRTGAGSARDGRQGRDAPGRRAGLNLWPFAFLLVAVAGVVAFAVWRHTSKVPVAEPEPEVVLSPEEEATADRVDALLGELTLEQKVAQLFVVAPEAITGVEVAVAAGDATREALTTYPVGGLVYFSANLESPSQVREMIRNSQNYVHDACGLPLFVCVDEEGGTVARVASNTAFGVHDVGDMAAVGAGGDASKAGAVGREVGGYLADLGFNVDFAPVADVASAADSVMAARSFGSDPELVAQMVAAEVEGFSHTGVLCAAKHFPGIGGAEGDSHNGRIYSSRTLEEMRGFELVPFEAAIRAGVPMVMVGHLSCLELNRGEGDLPASLSAGVIEGVLREELGYDGLVITDSLQMGAVSDVCGDDEVGVRAIEAGADLVLMPDDFAAAYKGLLGAVKTGKLSETRIDESVRRVIRAKLALM